jgi:hypothetical protein
MLIAHVFNQQCRSANFGQLLVTVEGALPAHDSSFEISDALPLGFDHTSPEGEHRAISRYVAAL